MITCQQKNKTIDENGQEQHGTCKREYKTQYGYRMHLHNDHCLSNREVKKVVRM